MHDSFHARAEKLSILLFHVNIIIDCDNFDKKINMLYSLIATTFNTTKLNKGV